MDGKIYIVSPSIMKNVENVSESFDISEAKNETVMTHMILSKDNSTYTVYIQGNDKIIANQNSSYLFYNFLKLNSIEGLEYFDASQVTNMCICFIIVINQ